MSVIQNIKTEDIRFPTSLTLDGSDAVNKDPDYSAAYLTITTDAGDSGHSLVFTLGRGNEIVTKALRSYAEMIVGEDAEMLMGDMGRTSKKLIHDSQFRWLGPEKGVSHMAAGGVLNALWDLKAKRANQPLWKLLTDMEPGEIVDLIDFTHLQNALTPEEALDILQAGEAGKKERIDLLERQGYPAYTTTPGWLGYSDEKLTRLAREAVNDGFDMIKLKVGDDLESDRRRLALAREAVGPDVKIAIDANQRWEVEEATEWTNALSDFDPFWIEEPTSTDDVLGHAAIRRGVSPTKVATGEAVMNRIIFKQLLQAEAIDVLQLDATRVAGVNENLAILLLARKYNVPVCPHAGGVGLCELVQHYSFFDFTSISTEIGWRRIEYVDHLHEHFVEPVKIMNGNYMVPLRPGSSAEMLSASRTQWNYQTGIEWSRKVS